jgi:hypothetical protein
MMTAMPYRGAVCLLAVALAASSTTCGGSPASPTPQPGTPVPVPAFTLTGRVVGTVTGEPIGGATVEIPGFAVVTDAAGGFTIVDSVSDVRTVVVTADGVIPRSSRVAIAGRHVTIDVIQQQFPFDLAFYRRLGRNAFETEGALEPLRPLSTAPRIHLRTVDDDGRTIDGETLDMVESALRDSAVIWSAGRFPLETVERGPGTRVGQSGWITVRWPTDEDADVCGRATLGTTTGYIELQYRNPDCFCGRRDLIGPRTVRHELGHVYGYWHTGDNQDVMSGIPWPRRLCHQTPSPRESEHTKYMYSRSAGNLDPDTDPGGGVVLSNRPTIVIDD